jgi:hypothetical protein
MKVKGIGQKIFEQNKDLIAIWWRENKPLLISGEACQRLQAQNFR